ncbi:MAG: hypothetical protein DSY37_02790 [Hyperthermus sp.]|nr:MAG: hypothetical protein DSY37_02790 [Hyperthermus sp.]
MGRRERPLSFSDYERALMSTTPLDVIREIEEQTPRERSGGRRRRPYPTGRELAEAIVEVSQAYNGHPDDFPQAVIEYLEGEGFDTRHVTVKRIWRIYESLVRRRVMADRLGVVQEAGPAGA